ncbi:MAG: O-antigen ligase family protein [Bacteroidales bacterium]|jgi:O-antigen ligase|nr:O-antigen ligase family protein [Bacteroidales bacterium]
MKAKHLPFLGIALFLAALLLKNTYSTYAMVIMLLCMTAHPVLSVHRSVWGGDRRFLKLLWKELASRWHPFFYVLCACYLINVAGLLYTGDLYLGVKRLDNTLPFLLFPPLFCMTLFSRENVWLLLRFFVWTVIAFCGFELLSYAVIMPEINAEMLYKDSKLYCQWLSMWPAHWHLSFDSTIALMAIPAALFLRFQAKPRITVIEMLLGVLLPVIFTVLGGARVGMVAVPFLLGLAYVFYCRFKPVLKWGLATVGIVSALLLYHRFPQVDDRFEDVPRKYMRSIAMEAIKEKPVFGWGTGYVSPLIQSPELAQRVGLDVPYTTNQFHNQYLENVVQFGISGALLLLALIGGLLYLGIRRKDYLLLSFLTIYLLFFWTETVLVSTKGVMPLAFWACFLLLTQHVRLKD